MKTFGLLTLLYASTLTAEVREVAVVSTPAPAQRALFSKDGRVAAVLCRDRKLRVFSPLSKAESRAIDISAADVDDLVISDDGAWIAAGFHDGTYVLWNANTGSRQWDIKLPFYSSALAFDREGQRLALAPANEPVQLYEVRSGKKLFEMQRTMGGTQAIAFSPDGSRIATADSDTVVRVYDARNGELLSRFTDFLLEPLAVAFTNDGKQILAAGGDQFVVWIDAATGKMSRKTANLGDPIAGLESSLDGTLTAARLLHAADMRMPAPVKFLPSETGAPADEWLPESRPLGGRWTTDGLLVAWPTERGVRVARLK